MDQSTSRPLPIACDLTPDEQRERRASLLSGLAERAASASAIDNGYRFAFSAASDVLQAISATIDAERQCCPFLDFDLRVPAGGGEITLTVSGPPGTRALLEAFLGNVGPE